MIRSFFTALLLLSPWGIAYSEFDSTGEVQLSAALVKHNLLLALEIPASAAPATSASGDSAAVRLRTLAGLLKDASRAFKLPKAAGCSRVSGQVLVHTELSPDVAPGISGGWEFECTQPDALTAIEIRLFSLLPVDSIQAVVFPDRQKIITPDDPSLAL
jgi:hypothetical protein|tara:strand:- start:182 stop:658 length:477 start_codon:yes stop_codon:yes gene_type:complete